MCLIAFLPIATSVPGTHLAKISTASSGFLRVKYDDCARPAAMLLITRRLRLDGRPVRDRDHHVGHVLAAADHFDTNPAPG